MTSADKQCGLNVFAKVRKDNAHITLDEVKDLVVNGTGAHKASINLARKEMRNERNLVTPNKIWKPKEVSEKHASFMEAAICKKGINFFLERNSDCE